MTKKWFIKWFHGTSTKAWLTDSLLSLLKQVMTKKKKISVWVKPSGRQCLGQEIPEYPLIHGSICDLQDCFIYKTVNVCAIIYKSSQIKALMQLLMDSWSRLVYAFGIITCELKNTFPAGSCDPNLSTCLCQSTTLSVAIYQIKTCWEHWMEMWLSSFDYTGFLQLAE